MFACLPVCLWLQIDEDDGKRHDMISAEGRVDRL